jgi:predicted DNA-binding protein
VGRTTISLDEETRDRLKALGRKGETYDDLVNRLIDHYLGVEREDDGDEIGFERVG